MRNLAALVPLLNLAFGMRGKRHHSAMRFLSGGNSSFLNTSTLLGAAGVAWGLFETLQARRSAPAPVVPGTTELRSPPGPSAPRSTVEVRSSAPSVALPPEAQRLVRLIVSAARADGALSAAERERCLAEARSAGVEALMREEFERPRPLAEITAGADDPALRKDLYTLAYCVARADEGVNGAERIYLAQLASLLRLDPAQTATLEQQADARIDAAARS